MGDQYKIRFSDRALADLRHIDGYIARDSPDNARRFIGKLVKSVDQLYLLPDRHPVYQAHAERHKVVRRLTVSPYLVYYRVRSTPMVIDVVTIRHAARLPPRIR